VRDEVEARMREQVEKILAGFDVVQREEFEAVKAMAARAREQADALEARVAALESQLADAKAATPEKPKRGKQAAEDP
jgi:BMFP domain-containing protein YqiC